MFFNAMVKYFHVVREFSISRGDSRVEWKILSFTELFVDTPRKFITAILQSFRSVSPDLDQAAPFTVRSTPDFRNTNGWNRRESHDCSELF